MKFETVLFDLDGTLTESGPGITRSVQYALKTIGIEADLSELGCFVGPPLNEAFPERYGTDEQTTIELIRRFRERYETVGLFENSVYPGIPELLQRLSAAGLRLAVASSKPEVFVHKILEHFGIDSCFLAAIGPSLGGELTAGTKSSNSRSEKELMIEAALLSLGLTEEDRRKTVMVGDRCYDIQGALANGIHAIGVSYGYGSLDELTAAGAESIADSAAALEKLLLLGN